MRRSLILLRGLPGSGKSTLGELLSEGKYPVVSIDDYFTDSKGSYDFKYNENHLAYKSCEERVIELMSKGVEKIFIANTCTIDSEILSYKKLAHDAGYSFFAVTVENYHGQGNIHGISKEQIDKMAAKYKVNLF
jgi:predicted kinase